MKVVSTANLRVDLQNDLRQVFTQTEFAFYKNMDEARTVLAEAEVLMTYGEDLTASEVDRAKNLQWIMVLSAGLEKMPLEKIQQKGIMVTNARGIHRIPMAEYTFTVLLQVAKNTKQWLENQGQAKWDRRIKMEELYNQTMAIIGPGAIGNEIARLAKAFGMTTIGISRSGEPVQHIDHIHTIEKIHAAVKEAKYIVSILPETDETRQLIGASVFKAMKSDAVFVNIGRGKTVDQTALLEALQTGTISHAVLDVFEEEPLRQDHPFWKMDNVTITPHFSAITSSYQPRALDIFKANLERYVRNESDFINLIDLGRGY